MSEEKKQKLKEHQKNYRESKKSRINNLFHSNQPKYCDVISSILSSETFYFFNIISFMFNSSSTSSLIFSFNFTIISLLSFYIFF